MEIGVDSFAAVDIEKGPPSAVERVNAVEQLIERIVFADNVGLDFFGCSLMLNLTACDYLLLL